MYCTKENIRWVLLGLEYVLFRTSLSTQSRRPTGLFLSQHSWADWAGTDRLSPLTLVLGCVWHKLTDCVYVFLGYPGEPDNFSGRCIDLKSLGLGGWVGEPNVQKLLTLTVHPFKPLQTHILVNLCFPQMMSYFTILKSLLTNPCVNLITIIKMRYFFGEHGLCLNSPHPPMSAY